MHQDLFISANEIAWLNADKPFISSNALQAAKPGDVTFKWVVGTLNGTTSHSDDGDPEYPGYRVYDGLPGLYSMPLYNSSTFTIVIDASASPLEFDWFGIINHNLGTLPISLLEVEIADDGAFTIRKRNLHSSNPAAAMANDHRWASMLSRKGSVEYMRLRITCAAGKPYIGQLIFGLRRQQQFQPTTPWNPEGQVSSMYDRIAPSGARMRQERYRARREMNATFRHSLSELHDGIEAWWPAIRHGADPFYIIDKPSSAITDFHMMRMREPALDYRQVSACTRTVTIDAVEQGPNFLSLEG